MCSGGIPSLSGGDIAGKQRGTAVLHRCVNNNIHAHIGPPSSIPRSTSMHLWGHCHGKRLRMPNNFPGLVSNWQHQLLFSRPDHIWTRLTRLLFLLFLTKKIHSKKVIIWKCRSNICLPITTQILRQYLFPLLNRYNLDTYFSFCLSGKDKATAAAANLLVQASQVHLAVNRSQLAVLITLCKSTQVLEVLTVVTLRSRPSPTDPYHSLSVPGVEHEQECGNKDNSIRRRRLTLYNILTLTY